MRKCSIIQVEAIHEIITPGIVKILNELNIKPTLYFNKECSIRRGDFFNFSQKLNFELVELELKSKEEWNRLRETIISSDSEFIIVNTLQNSARIVWYETLNLPIIGILHNVNMFLKGERAKDFINNPKNYVFTIAPHVSFYLRNEIGFDIDNVDFFMPCYLTDDLHVNQESKLNPVKRLSIIGGINNIRNRGFDKLIEYINLNKGKKEINAVFVISGGGKDRQKLEELVKSNDISEYFEFVEESNETGYVMYDEYFNSIVESDFLITLFPPADIKYFQFKATASIMTAVSLGLPIITDNQARSIYDTPCVSYDSANLETLFDLVSSISEEKFQSLKKDTLIYRELAIKRGVESFKTAISKILN